MAVLRAAFLALSILGVVSRADQLPRGKPMLAPAWQALENCAWPQAAYWASQLDRIDPPQALLYRLAWLEVPSQGRLRGGSTPDASPRDPIAWKADSEIWSDEIPVLLNQCPQGTSGGKFASKTFAELPQGVMGSLMGPALSSYPTYPITLRRVVRDYALSEWLQGRRLTLSAMDLPGDASTHEMCEWKALRVLHLSKEDDAPLSTLAQDCRPPTSTRGETESLLWSIIETKAGDHFLKSGRTDLAYRSFEAAIGLIPENRMPRALYYRLAVSGLLSGMPDDAVFRAADAALSEVSNGGEGALSPALQTSLQNLVCERLSNLRAHAIVSALKAIFDANALVPHLLRLTETCANSPTLYPLWKEVATLARSNSDRANLLARTLGSAVAKNSQLETAQAIRQLADLSRKSPYAASRALWSVFEHQLVQGSMPLTRKMIGSYRSQGTWTSSDDLRLKRLGRREDKLEAFPSQPVLTRLHQDHNVMDLPVALLAEPLSLRADIPAAFLSRAKSEWLK